MVTTRTPFHTRITSLQRALLAMGAEVRRAIPDATDAWLRRDCDAARQVDARTTGWSARARDVELAAYELIATQQPVASDLRRLTAVVRLTDDISRSGDLVAHVARSACFDRQPDDFAPALRSLVVEMAAVAGELWDTALHAWEQGDQALGRQVADADADLDELHHDLYATLLAQQVAPAPAVDLALLGRYLERLGDHAVEVAARA